jgi:hypothetical protein
MNNEIKGVKDRFSLRGLKIVLSKEVWGFKVSDDFRLSDGFRFRRWWNDCVRIEWISNNEFRRRDKYFCE